MSAAETRDTWTLDEFVEQVATALASAGLTGPPPDRRTLRYYATLGVLDRPTPVGREVRYGRRHLLQVLATRRLQADGARLAEIADRLAGLSDDELVNLARTRVAPRPGPSAFWEAQPHLRMSSHPEGASAATAPELVRHRTEVELADGVTLTVPSHPLTTPQVAALRAAAGPLLAMLSTMTTEETR